MHSGEAVFILKVDVEGMREWRLRQEIAHLAQVGVDQGPNQRRATEGISLVEVEPGAREAYERPKRARRATMLARSEQQQRVAAFVA